MAEYWQDIEERAQATISVWGTFFDDLTLGATTLAVFEGLTQALPGLAQDRDDATQALDEARQARDDSSQVMKSAGIRVPKIIEGRLDPESGLIDDLDKVYAIRPWSLKNVFERAKTLLPVWKAANTWLTSRVPAQAQIAFGSGDLEDFSDRLGAYPALTQAVKDKGLLDDKATDALAKAAREVEKLCIRFLKAAGGIADPGSPAESSLDTIPTTTVSNLPATLRMTSFSQGGTDGLQLLATYSPYGLGPGETAVLQYKRVDIDFDWQSVPYDASGNAIGPFETGQTVKARTRVTNTSGSRDGGERQLTLIAPV